MCHHFWQNVFMREPRPRPTLLVLSLETFKADTRLAGLSAQVSSAERQARSSSRVHNKPSTNTKLSRKCPSSNPHTSREPSSLFPRKFKIIHTTVFSFLNKSFIGIRQKWSPRRRLLSVRLEKPEIKSRSQNIKKQTKKICCKNSHQRIFSRKDFTPQNLMEEG